MFTPDGRRSWRSATTPRARRTTRDLVVLDASTLAPIGGEPVPIGSTGRMLAVTPDGRHAVVVASGTAREPGDEVLLVDLETRRIVRSTPVEPPASPSPELATTRWPRMVGPSASASPATSWSSTP